MKVHRFIINSDLKRGTLRLDDKELFNQFRNVLKLKPDEKITLGDGRMNEAEAEIRGYGKGFVEVEIKEVRTNQNEPKCPVILYCSILKRENFELVVQKATEIGVMEIVPIVTERTVKLGFRKDRLEKIIKEAAEQSGRGVVPVLHDAIDLKKAISSSDGNPTNLFCDSSGEGFENFKLKIENYPLGVWIGPEGGWTAQEVELAKRSNFKIINLGKLSLRAETAAIVACYLTVHNDICF